MADFFVPSIERLFLDGCFECSGEWCDGFSCSAFFFPGLKILSSSFLIMRNYSLNLIMDLLCRVIPQHIADARFFVDDAAHHK